MNRFLRGFNFIAESEKSMPRYLLTVAISFLKYQLSKNCYDLGIVCQMLWPLYVSSTNCFERKFPLILGWQQQFYTTFLIVLPCLELICWIPAPSVFPHFIGISVSEAGLFPTSFSECKCEGRGTSVKMSLLNNSNLAWPLVKMAVLSRYYRCMQCKIYLKTMPIYASYHV